MSSIFVIVYPQQQFNVSATLRHNGWDSAQSAPAAQQGQADPHFVGRFRGATFARVAYQPAADTQPANEANPHFAPRFRPQAFARPVNSWDTGESAQQFPQEANPHFLGKFRQSTPARPVVTWDSSASASPAQQGQADPHFIGQFSSPPLFRLRGFSPAADVPIVAVVDANPHYVGQFKNPPLFRIRGFASSADAPIVAVVDANPHYVGRFRPTQLSRPVSSWETGINPPSPVQQGQPDPHFVGRFRISALARVLYQPAFDVEIAPPPPPPPVIAPVLLFLVTARRETLVFSGIKATGTTEDLVISYSNTNGAPAVQIVLLSVPDGPYQTTVPTPNTTGYICSVTGQKSGAFAYGQVTVP